MSAIPQPVNYWICTNKSSFAQSLLSYKRRTGSLSEKQIAKVTEIIERDQQPKATVPARPQVKVDKLMAAFDAAIKNGFKFGKGQPKLRFKDFKASLAPASGVNPGAVYINNNDGLYLGKIVKGEFIKRPECTDAIIASITKTMENPLVEAIKYGRATGQCSCCGRILTNGESIRLGIGPICKSKFGF